MTDTFTPRVESPGDKYAALRAFVLAHPGRWCLVFERRLPAQAERRNHYSRLYHALARRKAGRKVCKLKAVLGADGVYRVYAKHTGRAARNGPGGQAA
jgi:hypothetical protein